MEWLFRCAAADPEQARKGHWLSRLLVGFLAIMILWTVLMPFVLDAPLDYLGPNLGAIGLLTILYLLNRFGWVGPAALGTLVAVALVILQAGYASTANVDNMVYPALLSVMILTVGLFLTWRWVVVAVVASSAFCVWYDLYSNIPVLQAFRAEYESPASYIAYMIVLLFAATGAVSWLSGRLLGGTVADLRQRNAELAHALADLAAQTEHERSLGADIGDLATRLTAVSTRQASGVTTQAASIGQVVSTVAELYAAADQIAARAEEVRQAAEGARASVQRSQALVLRSREAVQRNRAQVQEVITRMDRLTQVTAGITRFVNNIRALSDEVHLLALNATIEAAGAGPLGRRFGVVAAEVQNLAQRSNAVVDQVRLLIAELQEAGAAGLAVTESSIAVADEVEALADEMRSTQEQVVGAVEQTSALIESITMATSQQMTATEQVTHTMQEIAEVADTTSLDTTALEHAIADLTRAAASLNAAMTRLKAQVPA